MVKRELEFGLPGRIRMRANVKTGQSLTFRRAALTIDGDDACLEIFPGNKKDHIRISLTKDQALKLAELIYTLTGTTAAVFDNAIAAAAKQIATRTVKAYLKEHQADLTGIQPSDLDQQEITAEDLIIDDQEIARIIASLPT